MKEEINKNNQNNAAFLINLLLIIAIIVSIPLYFIPENSIIEVSKANLKETVDYTNSIKQKGISFSDFKQKLSSGNLGDLHLDFIKKNIKIIKEDFFNDYFNNTKKDSKFKDYSKFIEGQKKVIEKKELEKSIEKKVEDIDYLIPYYSNGVSSSESALTDFKFVNYIESLIKTFDLNTTNPIGITTLNPIIKDKKALTENQYYSFVLKLDLKGKKKNILNFLHYLENVGSVLLDKTGEISLHKDPFLYRNLFDVKKINGDKLVRGYNLYRHYFSEITNLKMPEYIDTYDSEKRKETEQSLVSFVIANQGTKDDYSISLDLKFYVRGIQSYKINETIQTILKESKQLSDNSKKLLKKVNNREFRKFSPSSASIVIDLQSIDSLLDKNIKILSKRLKTSRTSADLNKEYVSILQYSKNLDRLKSIFKEKENKVKKVFLLKEKEEKIKTKEIKEIKTEK